jgi:hypothetical protein
VFAFRAIILISSVLVLTPSRTAFFCFQLLMQVLIRFLSTVILKNVTIFFICGNHNIRFSRSVETTLTITVTFASDTFFLLASIKQCASPFRDGSVVLSGALLLHSS